MKMEVDYADLKARLEKAEAERDNLARREVERASCCVDNERQLESMRAALQAVADCGLGINLFDKWLADKIRAALSPDAPTAYRDSVLEEAALAALDADIERFGSPGSYERPDDGRGTLENAARDIRALKSKGGGV